MRELNDTARAGAAQRVGDLINEALKAYANGEYENAGTLAAQAKDEATRSPRIRELLGLSYYQTERWQDAARELLTYRRLTNRNDQNHVIADCYRALERPDRAIEICSEVVRQEVSEDVWAEVVIVAASAFADKGDLSRALSEMNKADLETNSVQAHNLRLWYVRADLLERAGKKAQAHELWERVYADDPRYFDVADRLKGS
ncbi:MAG: tetratricopeptide repeat protein [Actinomycetota bacterium]|nr:hypothetical protein [Actinomycetota bacterium]